jgi:apolipoprotein N-acyltransferase
VTEIEAPPVEGGEPHHLLVQAPVAPVDADGVVAAQAGTLLFGLLTALCWWASDTLIARGDAWWLWVGPTGVGLGLVLVGFTRWRRSRAMRRAQSNSASSTAIESHTGSGR